MVKDKEEVVKEMLNPIEFDIAEHIKSGGFTIPRSQFVLPTDGASAYRIHEIDEELDGLGKNASANDYGSIAGPMPLNDPAAAALEKERAELIEKLHETRIIVHLRGISPSEMSVVRKRADQALNSWLEGKETKSQPEKDEYRGEWASIEFLTLSIEKIEFPSTNGVQSKIDHKTVEVLLDNLNPALANALHGAANDLAFTGSLVDIQTDAGFLSGRTESAA